MLPVLGVPVQSQALNGLDSLLSIVQMPGGVPVATLAIGKAGATNAALLAVASSPTAGPSCAQKLHDIPRGADAHACWETRCREPPRRTASH